MSLDKTILESTIDSIFEDNSNIAYLSNHQFLMKNYYNDNSITYCYRIEIPERKIDQRIILYQDVIGTVDDIDDNIVYFDYDIILGFLSEKFEKISALIYLDKNNLVIEIEQDYMVNGEELVGNIISNIDNAALYINKNVEVLNSMILKDFCE